MATTPAQHQTRLDRVGDDDDRAAFVEQLVRNGLLGNVLDFTEHTHRIAGALVFLGAGIGIDGQQARRQQQNKARQAAHGELRRSMHKDIASA
ncbi:hypothetical protein D9M70_578560 [compost metagenome]